MYTFQTLLRDPQPGPSEPGGSIPELPPATQVSTESLSKALAAEFKGQAPATPAATAPAATPNPDLATPGSEPSPGTPTGAATPDLTNPNPDGDALPKGVTDPQVIGAFARERAAKRELRLSITAAEERANEEKKRADALAAQVEELKKGQPVDPSKRSEPTAPTAPAADPLANHPLVKEARAQKQEHAGVYTFASQMLTTLDRPSMEGGGLEPVLAALKQNGANVEGVDESAVRLFLSQVRDNALLRHGESAAHLSSLEAQAQRELGAVTQSWAESAYAVMPELKDPKSNEAAEAAKAMKAFPALASDPRGLYAIAAMIEGQKVLAARAQRKAAPAKAPANAPANPPAQLPGVAASLPAPTATQDARQAAWDAYVKNPTEENRKVWVKAQMGIVAPAAA